MEHNWIGTHWSVGTFWEKLLHCETSIFQELLNAYRDSAGENDPSAFLNTFGCSKTYNHQHRKVLKCCSEGKCIYKNMHWSILANVLQLWAAAVEILNRGRGLVNGWVFTQMITYHLLTGNLSSSSHHLVSSDDYLSSFITSSASPHRLIISSDDYLSSPLTSHPPSRHIGCPEADDQEVLWLVTRGPLVEAAWWGLTTAF